ncbi:hypothetical protein MIND_01319100 [Mycena indigotica]|uniref:Mannoprotein n=1 Tax=Mycena indigotica TaxID=2126181 RepID=A0A8H6S1M2_9AGAR|nr:uncharacterized protein MIND_01319100 [Mycena indigotica]KAF7290782.1 hypothetical protein MIND_01319100 [Mycena indigotica]
MFSPLLFGASLFATVHAASSSFPAGVIATGTQGVTNPPVPTMGTPVNQSSMARLLTINSIDDFCIFAPPTVSDIGNSETEEVAWCTKARNNARIIPDGTLTGVSFLRNSFYVQVLGFGDFTKLNIPAGDQGGELDPHGATGAGNPVGGNVTTNIVDNVDEPIAEWMLFISDTMFCIRACVNANATYDAAHMCWHELDEMGCEFVMPGNYNFNGTFETCDADIAYPPGWYPSVDASGSTSFSTFAQFFTGVFTGANGQPTGFTVGDTVTPTAPASIPSSSNCVTTPTISNGIQLNGAGSPTSTSSVAGGGGPASGAGGQSGSTGTSSGPQPTDSGNAASRAARVGGTEGEFTIIALFATLVYSYSGLGLHELS